ncbi:hypothetical protein KO02_16295 [Sphingobacterium sp. ML3W]|uniref:hypothetical protein n=1 Tax=Sphingobacterium sp. ML3W TaxID=1538644 RepID=UPI0004F8655E|nr:hypothetical protein [Sphingobacterium sp. ML3W]AIM38070.1 hypothetical protein KO02_16295 [Sphingobacterium sp. ML3W]
MIFKDELPVILIFMVVMAAIVLALFFVKQSKTPLTKVEFEESDKNLVTIWLDLGGMIVKSDEESNYWEGHIVINPQNLNVGDQMVIYNLSEDAVRRSSYLVLKVKQEN